MWYDEQEILSYEERDAVMRELYAELMDEALIEVAHREAIARQPAPVPDDEIPW